MKTISYYTKMKRIEQKVKENEKKRKVALKLTN